ncbi:MAG: YhjD/YihY/BrkB family envelope integrity protein [Acidimicrobiia bacterium]
MLRTAIGTALKAARELQRRYNAIGGPTLAGGVTLYGFLAMFALLVLGVAVLGYISAGDSNLAGDLTRELGLTGQAARMVTSSVEAAQDSRRLTTVFGVIGIVWLGSSFALVVANAFDAAWRVPGRGLHDRVIGLVWLAGGAVLAVVSGGATALWALLPSAFAPLVIVVTIVGNGALWMWTSWLLPNRSISWRPLLVPALIAAVLLEVLKVAGAYVVPHFVATSSELYGSIGVIFAILLWLLVLGRLVVYLAVIEAWRAEGGRSPRPLKAGAASSSTPGRP